MSLNLALLAHSIKSAWTGKQTDTCCKDFGQDIMDSHAMHSACLEPFRTPMKGSIETKQTQ